MKAKKLFCQYKSLSVITLFSAIALSVTATTAEADFLDDLFGGGASESPAPARAAPSGRAMRSTGGVSFSIRSNQSERRRAAFRKGGTQEAAGKEGSGGTKAQKTVFCATGLPAREDPANAEVRLHDGTLRAGDSVVTMDGILVFKGRAACPHNASDFVGIGHAKLPTQTRNALQSLEHTMQAGRTPLVLEDKEAEPQVVSQASH